eukprot:gene7751-biopygen4583
MFSGRPYVCLCDAWTKPVSTGFRIQNAQKCSKLAKSCLKDAQQRRGYTRSLPMGPIDGTHGKHRKSSKMQGIMPGTVQEWHAEDVIFEACWRILQAFWHPKLAKRCLKDASRASKTSQKLLERRAATT